MTTVAFYLTSERPVDSKGQRVRRGIKELKVVEVHIIHEHMARCFLWCCKSTCCNLCRHSSVIITLGQLGTKKICRLMVSILFAWYLKLLSDF